MGAVGFRAVTTSASPAPVSAAPSPSPFSALSRTGTTKMWLACGMCKGFDGLAVLVQQALKQSPHLGALFASRGKRGHLVKLLWYNGQRAFGKTCRAIKPTLRYDTRKADRYLFRSHFGFRCAIFGECICSLTRNRRCVASTAIRLQRQSVSQLPSRLRQPASHSPPETIDLQG
jgi:hypothetical protein